MKRKVQRELLDELPADDRGAIGARRDLRVVNALMGTAPIMVRALNGTFTGRTPQTIVELGAGDGTSLLRLAKSTPRRATPVRATLVDRQELLSAETKQEFAALSWHVESRTMDVFDWLERPNAQPSDLTIASLFLHHFAENDLRRLLGHAARQTGLFLACEPKRAGFPLFASTLLGLIGCNGVTRHDAKVSVRAGFAQNELSALWPEDEDWKLTERPAGLFSHCFAARRAGERGADGECDL
ncbi:MAG: methyltransferase domain-containing protein [Candidatus Acidiferrales bacterium]